MADTRLTDVKDEFTKKDQELDAEYAGIQQQYDTWHQGALNDIQEQQRIQDELADQQLANTEQKIEQQKETARQNKETEEKKALNEYTAFNNPYGYQAELLASQGLSNSGLSETTKLGSFNTYQNRLASANKVLQEAITTYDMEINDARLNNDVIKAQNAYNTLEQKLTYGEKYWNNTIANTLNKINAKTSLSNEYFDRYQTVYQNIKNEEATAEAIRQFNEKMAEEKRQFNADLEEQQRQFNEQMNYKKEQDKINNSGDDKPIDEEVTTLKSINYGNSATTRNKSDYLFNNTQNQPRYIYDQKLIESGVYAGDLGIDDCPSTNRIWKARIPNAKTGKTETRFFVWIDKTTGYVEIDDSSMVKKLIAKSGY